MTRKQKGLCYYSIFYFVSVIYFSSEQAVSFRVCGNFCGANWCNGGKRSEWTSDDNHCGPEYLVPQENRKTGGPSCADACCKNHDICCSPGGNDLPNSILLTNLLLPINYSIRWVFVVCICVFSSIKTLTVSRIYMSNRA